MKQLYEPHPVMKLPENQKVIDLSDGYNADELQEFVESGGWGIGGYLERRKDMYTSPLFDNKRYIHVGIDIWAAAGEPVYSPLDGILVYKKYHQEPGNYGGAVVLKLEFHGGDLYGLFGHLSKESIHKAVTGKNIRRGEEIGKLGVFEENGNWPPHLHFQLCTTDPGVADMPGVVAEEDLQNASEMYPDPRTILGPVYE